MPVHRLLGFVALAVVMSSLFVGASVVNAQVVTELDQTDLDGDGDPDVAIMRTQLATPNDAVRVYDSGDTMPWGSDWQTVTNFEDNSWVFDVNSDGSPQLVIFFSREGDRLSADIHTDRNGDLNVDTIIDGVRITVVEAGIASPIVTVMSDGDWYLPDGLLNWNVTFQTDGATIFTDNPDVSTGIEFVNFIGDFWAGFLPIGGGPDTEFEFHDTNRDGIPEYFLWRLLAETPSHMGAQRARIWANVGQYEPQQPALFHFWPFIVPPEAESLLSARNYFDTPPYMIMNWDTSSLSPPLFHGYPIEHGYHIHNFAPFEKGEINYANFEILQGYYDLAEDRDGSPELHIRHRYFDSDDNLGWGLDAPINEVRFSWNQFNSDPLRWDYGFGLAGRHHIDTVVDFPDFSVITTPYETAPEWVVSSEWDIVTFLAPEQFWYPSSEGIYEWAPVESPVDIPADDVPSAEEPQDFRNSMLSRYLAGEEYRVDLRDVFNEIPAGMRADAAFSGTNYRPYVYLSSVDHKLHLLRADVCLWQLDENAQIRCENLDGDSYLDQWLLYEDNQLASQLMHVQDYLVYAGGTEVVIKRTEVPPAIFDTLPPINHEQWVDLGDALAQNMTTAAPDDFRAMVMQFNGPTLAIDAAVIRDFRLSDSGFRFVLQVTTPFTSAAPFTETAIQILPGEYVVETSNGTLDFEALTPPDLSVRMSSSSGPYFQNTHSTFSLHLTNAGLDDARNVLVRLIAEDDDQTITVDEVRVDAFALDTQTIQIVWAPPSGTWQLRAELLPNATYDEQIEEWLSAESVQSFPLGNVETQNQNSPSWLMFLSLDKDLPFCGLPVLLMLLSLAIAAGTLAFLINRQLAE